MTLFFFVHRARIKNISKSQNLPAKKRERDFAGNLSPLRIFSGFRRGKSGACSTPSSEDFLSSMSKDFFFLSLSLSSFFFSLQYLQAKMT